MSKGHYEIIRDLIALKKEGSHWDFKQQWHENNADLVHDILSLANNIEHKGDRFLVIGVSDPPECKVIGFTEKVGRKRQSDLLDLFSKLSFQGGISPDLYVETFSIEEKEVDVIVIKDKPFKPYCLQKEYNFKNTMLRAGSVYGRVGDRNTAKDSTTDLYHTEKMWRERFYLDKTPLDRIEFYLQDYNGWHSDGISKGHYKQFPEFTLEYSLDQEKVTNRWWSHLFDKQTELSKIIFRYHATVLEYADICRFPSENISIPYPNVDTVKIDNSQHRNARNTYCLFSYTKDSFEFSLLLYLYGGYKEKADSMLEKNALSSPDKPPIGHIPFIIFNNRKEKEDFISELEEKIDIFFKESKISPKFELGENQLKEEEVFANWAYEKYFDRNRVSISSSFD